MGSSTQSAQRLRSWTNIVQMLYKCFVFAGCAPCGGLPTNKGCVTVITVYAPYNDVYPVSTKHFNNIYTMAAQRLRRWASIV